MQSSITQKVRLYTLFFNRKQRNFVKTLKRPALKSYCTDVSANSGHPGEFWKKFQCLLPRRDKQSSHIQLNEGCRLIPDSVDVTNLLNDYFIHATDMPDLHQEAFKSHPSIIVMDHMSSHFLPSGNPASRSSLVFSNSSNQQFSVQFINQGITSNSWPSGPSCSNDG